MPLKPGLLDIAADFIASHDSRRGEVAGHEFAASMALTFLLRCYKRSGDRRYLDVVELTLDKMAGGGIYDQLGGGFHRYSVESVWLVPH